MKPSEEQLDKLYEMIKNDLKERLKREPTEREVCEKLPVFLCENDDKSIVEDHKK